MSSNQLPEQFLDLERFIEWALPQETDRNYKRLTSTMDELRTFYDAMLLRIESILDYLNQFPLEQMPEDAQRLMYLSFSLCEAAFAVEVYGQTVVLNSFQEYGELDRFIPLHE